MNDQILELNKIECFQCGKELKDFADIRLKDIYIMCKECFYNWELFQVMKNN